MEDWLISIYKLYKNGIGTDKNIQKGKNYLLQLCDDKDSAYFVQYQFLTKIYRKIF